MGEALGDRPARAVRREIVEHGGVELLVRTSGPRDGDPWLLLHGAGETSRTFVPIATALGRRARRVLVPDIPGCGQSEALAGDVPTIDDYAAVIGGLIDAVPGRRWTVYGRHFGARVAIALATHNPDRISSIVLDGIGRYSRRERDRMRRHAAPLVVPDTDGAYLITAFQRVRDYALFFPWFDRTARARRATGVPEASVLHERLLEILSSSAGIRDAYGAALDYPAETHLETVRATVVVCRRAGDNIPDPLPTLRTLRPDLVAVDLPDGPGDAVEELLRAVRESGPGGGLGRAETTPDGSNQQ